MFGRQAIYALFGCLWDRRYMRLGKQAIYALFGVLAGRRFVN